ncbi:peptidoglycan-binding protein [Arthrobacter sp. FW306-05-C]|uniref:peptidoglycan-binding protein n=1 Tax=unclassified Arthrobacter TaxID=235627 RepID=UPI001EF10592|nr:MULTISPECIES: peptidoglycan-binding protein [unclassified Arthrobacter]UKA65881.1 peptidoglycan-binding protein [Arthrobacter sp. FW306-05-C]UKA74543.1 peptidoglycan-binding protein [Arthrobacter sp. FW306-07-I]
MDNEMRPLTDEELMSEQATALPDKEVASVLDLNADLDLGINAAAPIDLAVAANANVAAPIDAAASANILSYGSDAQALSSQDATIDQGITADANADSTQDSVIGQGDGTTDTGTTDAGTADATAGTVTDPTSTGGLTDTVGGALNGNLLNVDVNLDADAAIAAPINGAVAANANVAAPIDAAVAANIGSIDSRAYAISDQSATISQHIDGEANATAGQQSDLQQ